MLDIRPVMLLNVDRSKMRVLRCRIRLGFVSLLKVVIRLGGVHLLSRFDFLEFIERLVSSHSTVFVQRYGRIDIGDRGGIIVDGTKLTVPLAP